MARVLIRDYFSVFGLPNQIHRDNGKEFINKLWIELFSELKILHTKTPPYNSSSNIMEGSGNISSPGFLNSYLQSCALPRSLVPNIDQTLIKTSFSINVF